jgi:carbon monoxide dehydrogenase subunit G
MARFSTTLQSGAPAQQAFDHLADFATVADWDPGISEATLIAGEPGRVGARYRVVASIGPRRFPLEYVVLERVDPVDGAPGHVVLFAEAGSFTAHDTITVTPEGTGSQVRYDAVLTLKGVGRVMDWPLHLSFQVIGRRAEQGLRAWLAGLAVAQGTLPE